MKLLQIDGWGLFFRLVAEDACRAFEKLVRRENDPPDRFLFLLTPLLDLVVMNIELLGKFGEGLFTANGGEGHLRFESRTVIPAGSYGHGRLLYPAKQPICRQKSHLTTLFRCPEPPLTLDACGMAGAMKKVTSAQAGRRLPRVQHVCPGRGGALIGEPDAEPAPDHRVRADL